MAQAGEGRVWISAASLAALKGPGEALGLNSVRGLSRVGSGHLAAIKGRGMEFEEARPYMPGDDVRSLDWRVTARTGRAHTKLFREERERPVVAAVDFRASMFFATRGRFKSVQACRLAALLAWAARHRGDRVGGLLFAEQRHLELRPQTGDTAVMRLLGCLAEWSGGTARTIPEDGSTANPLLQALLRLRRMARSGSLIFLISDFRGFDQEAQAQLLALARHNEVFVIWVYDVLEQDLPGPGLYPLVDGPRRFLLDSADVVWRSRYRQRFAQRRGLLEASCLRPGMHLMSLATEDQPERMLRNELGVRLR